MANAWWRRAIERRLELLAAFALLVWVATVMGAAWSATAQIEAALATDREARARFVAGRVERAIDAELRRLYHEPGGAQVGPDEQLQRAVVPLTDVVREYSDAQHRIALLDRSGRELTASGPAAGDGGRHPLVSTAAIGRTGWSVRVTQPVGDTLGPVLWLRRLLAWSSLLTVIVAVLLAWGAAQSVRRPVERLTRDARRLARGELDQPIAPAGADEIGQLAAALEAMRQALAHAFTDVSTLNAELERRVEDRTRELSSLYAALQEHDERRGQLLRKVIAAQEEERKRLARELHDETSQQLTALAMQLEMLAPELRKPVNIARLDEARGLVSGMVDDLHRVIYDLRPSMLDDLGLLPAIRWFAERRLAPRGIAVRFEFPEAPLDLPPEARTAVYRVVQEALTNVERHAQAETVMVACSVGEDQLVIEVEDDGAGFDPEQMQQPRETGQGLGLLGMRERLSLLGGTCEVESQPGQGTRVVVTLPIR
jgi:signal transduction histidine kinase